MSGGQMDASVRGGLKFSFCLPSTSDFLQGTCITDMIFVLKKHFEKQVCCKERSFYPYFFFFFFAFKCTTGKIS